MFSKATNHLFREKKPVDISRVGYWLDAQGSSPVSPTDEETADAFILFTSKEQFFVDKKIWTTRKAAKRLLVQTSERHYVNFYPLKHIAYGIPQSLLIDHEGKKFYSGLEVLDLWRKADRPFSGMPDGNAIIFVKIKGKISQSGFVINRQGGLWQRSQAFSFMSDDGSREIDNLFAQWKLSDTTEIIEIDIATLLPYAAYAKFYQAKLGGEKFLFEHAEEFKKLPITYILLGAVALPSAFYGFKSYQAYTTQNALKTKIIIAQRKNEELKIKLENTIKNSLPNISARLDIDASSLLSNIETLYLKGDKIEMKANDQGVDYEIGGTWIEQNKRSHNETYVTTFFERSLDGCSVKKTTSGDASKIKLSIHCDGNPHPLHRIAHF